jgi:two-component system osmolarity sensor histidine kinase EnvZ
MTLLPRSLLWRTILVVGTTVVVGQFLWLEIVDYYQSRQGAQIAILQTVSMVEIQQHALEVMPEAARPGYMRRLEQQRRIHFEPVVPGVLPGEEPEGPVIKAIAEQLRTSLGPQVEVRIESPDPHVAAGHATATDPGPEPGSSTAALPGAAPVSGPNHEPVAGLSAAPTPTPAPEPGLGANPGAPAGPGPALGPGAVSGRAALDAMLPPPPGRRIWIKLPIGQQQVWMVIHQRRPPPPQSWIWLEWGMMVMVLAIGASVFVILRIRAPLRELSQAARQIGRGEEPAPIGGRGPAEIDELQKSFTQMRTDLKRIENDRALVLAGISHDLRTPLARMRLSAEMLTTDPTAREGMVSDIEEMDAIINQFLDFARDVSGEAPAATSVNAVATAVAEHYARLHHPVNLNLMPVPDIQLRPVGMRRLVTNLVDNALRYGDNVEVETRMQGKDIVLEIKDRGPGIPETDLERVKMPFTRLESSRGGGVGAGAGLGLAIADRVVRLHGGILELVRREGGGLIARVRLPVLNT